MAWVWLAAAGALEVAWIALLKRSEGFTELRFSLACVGAVALSFWCMSQSLRSLPTGTAYAVWSGLGIVGGFAWGIALEGEPLTTVRITCVGLILAGVVGLKLGS